MRLPIASYGRWDCFLACLAWFLLAAGLAWGGPRIGQPALAWAALLPAAIGIFWASFYRDFERTIPTEPGLVVAPADGRVTDVVEVEEKDYIGGKVLRIGIFLSPLNVHVNRAPLAGTVELVKHRPGQMLKAYDPRCIDLNESTLLGLRTESGLKVGVRQVTGAAARRIVCAVAPGARLARGERYGMIKLGSRTELLMPVEAGFACAVQVGDMVTGGVSVLGRLPLGASAASGGVGAAAGETRGAPA